MQPWMLRCVSHHTCARVCRATTSRAARWSAFTEKTRPACAPFATTTRETSDERSTPRPWPSRSPRSLSMIQLPGKDQRHDPQAWLALLEPGLPHHLRRQPSDHPADARDIGETGQLLLLAQNQSNSAQAFDLIVILAHEQERWAAVIWLVKRLVEKYGALALRPSSLQQAVASWNFSGSLDDVTRSKTGFATLSTPETDLISPTTGQPTLHELTDNGPDRLDPEVVFAHRVLGQIWRSLGRMTLACAEAEMKPEILEIIAYLHHMGIMPASIYNQKPSADITSVQQPPTLNLLSSRILISLSDAAWRAHERDMANDTSMLGGNSDSAKVNPPGSRYRISVAGLRPEVWLELLLWSCLHGGWIRQGAEILRMLHDEKDDSRWKPFSWRTVVPSHDTDSPDWDKLEYAFNTRLPTAMDPPDNMPDVSVRNTISSEVINAYVDALASSVGQGVGARGLSVGYIVELLRMLQKFLWRSQLSLVAGSWDAILLRLVDMHDHIIDQKRGFAPFINLSPYMGAELESSPTRNVPEYVFDGSAAINGLYHRAITSRIKAGDVRGAFTLFQALQERSDTNKYRSIVDFAETEKPTAARKGTTELGLFTSNFSGIAYPAFEMQIPATILGPFLDLVIDAQAFDFATWLIYSKEIDGPVIPERIYAEKAIAPALIRYASELDDKELLAKVLSAREASIKEAVVPEIYLRSVFRSQIDRKGWSSAIRTLQYMQNVPDASLSTANIAHVARAMLVERHNAKSGDHDAVENSNQLQTILKSVLSTARRAEDTPRDISLRRDAVRSKPAAAILLVLSYADPYLAEFCQELMPPKNYYFLPDLHIYVFNLLLDGISQSYGFLRARQTLYALSTLRPQAQTDPQSGTFRPSNTMSRFEPKRSIVHNTVTVQTSPPRLVSTYGLIRPDHRTMVILLRRAIEEHKASGQIFNVVSPDKSTTSDALLWTVRRWQMLELPEEDIRNELDGVIPESALVELFSPTKRW